MEYVIIIRNFLFLKMLKTNISLVVKRLDLNHLSKCSYYYACNRESRPVTQW